MSYHTQDATAQLGSAVEKAISSRDVEALFKYAQVYREQGEDEQAEALRKEAQKIEREDWSFDNERDNEQSL
jgi:hypothetical protein